MTWYEQDDGEPDDDVIARTNESHAACTCGQRHTTWTNDKGVSNEGHSVACPANPQFAQPSAAYLNERRPTMGYWKKPHYSNGVDGGNLLLGPVQLNWFNNGFRVHFTWPFRQPKTVTLWQR